MTINPYLDPPKKPEEPDTYYEDKSRTAIQNAIDQAAGKPIEVVRFQIHRSYPFGALRKGRPYKIWRRLVLEKEAEMGLLKRTHSRRRNYDYPTDTKRI